jgi:hypothetical protein
VANEKQDIWGNAPRWENINYGETYNDTTRPSHILPASIDETEYKTLVTAAMESVEDQKAVWSDFPPEPNGTFHKTVIIDLDRNVLTVDSKKHFPLPKFPHDFLNKANGRRIKGIYLLPPKRDAALVALYNSCSPSIIPSKTLLPDSNRTRRTVASHLLKSFMHKHCGNIDFYLKEFRKIAYTCIKLASVDQIQLQPTEPLWGYWYKQENWEGLRLIEPPPSDMYSVPGGKYGQVLIHLAHHSISKDPKSAIGRVIDHAQSSGKSHVTACIFSLTTVIIVDIAIVGGETRVSHTIPAVGDFSKEGWGGDLLASVLVPCTASYGASVDEILPRELIEQIFRHFCYSNGGEDDLLNWRLTCRAFNDLADRFTIPIKPCTMLNFPTGRRNSVFLKDADGYFTDCTMGDFDINPTIWEPFDRETKEPIGVCILKLIENQ